MKLCSWGALALGALLAPGCAAGRVGPPPRPPELAAGSARASQPEAPAAAPSVSSAPSAAPATPQPASLPPATLPIQAPAAEPKTPSDPPAAAATPPMPELPPLGWIAGKPLEAEELLLEWGDASARELWLVLDKLVAARLALAEADRLGIRVDPAAVDERYGVERSKLEKQVERGGKDGGKDTSLETFIQRELGFEPKRYLERVRRATIRQMLAERAVRATSLAEESLALRLIVVGSDEDAEQVRTALSAGRPFAEVASELSLDDTKKNGGYVPFLAREERSPLSRLAFQTAVGAVAGPTPLGDHQFWIQVEEKRTPVEGDWNAVGQAVEASLALHPVGDAEFVHWKLAMERRYPIDLGPLWTLIGAAR